MEDTTRCVVVMVGMLSFGSLLMISIDFYQHFGI